MKSGAGQSFNFTMKRELDLGSNFSLFRMIYTSLVMINFEVLGRNLKWALVKFSISE